MSLTGPQTPEDAAPQHMGRRRHEEDEGERLQLVELDPKQVIASEGPCELTSFGTIRETCPACPDSHLRLVLRQELVRRAHLMCPACGRCFDAFYPDGRPALSLDALC